ncbi:hypothetical protein FB446DRAFT_696315 [Lentinula raphanica]|nr:hypothetical protein FB446DRAFT_696315 [Lentinula raphanica]
MNLPKSNNAHVQLLACLLTLKDAIDPDDSYYRFLVDGKYVKYVTVAPGTLAGEEIDWSFAPILLGELLPSFPPGDWNNGHVAKDPETGKVTFIRTETESLAGVKNLWHPVKVNELDFANKQSLRQRINVSTHPQLNNGKPVLTKIAVWPWELEFMEAETAAYEAICGKGIGPKFLGHVTEGENGRVIGFVTEWIEDTRAAGPEDFESCRKALGRLHALGIKLGDTNKFNFLVREGHDVVIVDFETAKKCSPGELEYEMNALREFLEEPGFRGGTFFEDITD